MSKGRILVTGAAGMVGSHIVEEAVAAGFDVVAAVREDVSYEPPEGVLVRSGDLRDAAFVRSLVGGVDHVIHAAGIVDLGADYPELSPTNVDTVRLLFEASEATDVARFVYISTAAVYAARGGLIDEGAPRGASSAYEQTKIDAEDFLLQAGRTSRVGVTILRPGLIYGKRGRVLAAAIVAVPTIVAQFMPLLPGFTGGPRTNWVHASDVGRAALLVLAHESARQQAYNVADDTPVAFGEALTFITSAQGLPIGPMIPWPPQSVIKTLLPIAGNPLVLGAIDQAVAQLWRHVRRRYGLEDAIVVRLERGMVPYATHDMTFNIDKLKALGFVPKHGSIHEGFPEVLDWYWQHKWLPDLRGVLETHRTEAGLRVRFSERLTGEGRNPRRTASLEVSVDAPILAVADGREALIDGYVSIAGLCDDAPMQGTLKVALWTERRVVYEFAFLGADEATYRLRGVKTLTPTPWELLSSWTRMPFTVQDSGGRTICEGELKADLRAVLSTLASARLAYEA